MGEWVVLAEAALLNGLIQKVIAFNKPQLAGGEAMHPAQLEVWEEKTWMRLYGLSRLVSIN